MLVSPTLAVNELIAARRRAGRPVLPLGFGEAGLPVAPELCAELARHAHRNGYGPVTGIAELRTAAAGYWARRGLPTEPDHVLAGPGSKSLLYALILATDGDVLLPRPSWVSYAAQAELAGRRSVSCPIAPGTGGVPDPGALAGVLAEAAAAGRRIGTLVLTQPDNPTGGRADTDRLRAVADLAERHDLLVISDEIYRDLLFPGEPAMTGVAELIPERTVVTTGLSKSLALGGWRIGAARVPAGPLGAALLPRLAAIASELWSAPAQPVQWAAAYAFGEPAPVRHRVARAAALYARITGAVAERLRAAGCTLPTPRGGFYAYPDFAAHAERLRAESGVRSGAALADLLLHRHGVAVLPGSAFGDEPEALRLRLATSQLIGDTDADREAALTAADPLSLPAVRANLDRLTEVLAAVTGTR